jgi:hypothetical protein
MEGQRLHELVALAIGAVAVLLVAAAIALVMVRGNRRTERLRRTFGPEYDRAIERAESKRQGEAELEGRLRRRRDLKIRIVDPSSRDRYAELWRQAQLAFNTSPSPALGQTQGIITDVMREMGYPDEGSNRRIEDLSVDHPQLVQHYRAACRAVEANDRGQANPGGPQGALRDFGVVIEALLGAPVASPSGGTSDRRSPTDQL